MKSVSRVIASAAVLPLLLAGSVVQADWTDANRALVDGYVIPRYKALARTSSQLAAQTGVFCRAADAAGLEKVRGGFHAIMDAWQAIGQLSFGPVELFMRRYRFALWPDKHGTGGRQLRTLLAAKDPEILPRETFARASVAVQGLPALERLLFEKGLDGDAFGTDEGPSYRCKLVAAITDNLAGIADETLRGWTAGQPSYRELVLTASQSNAAFSSSEEVAALFLRDLRTALQTVADLKLERPLGKRAAQAKPKQAESWRSGRSLRNIRIDLAAAHDLYAAGYAPRLTSEIRTADLDKRIQAAFAEALAAAALDEPLKDLVADPAQRLRIERLLASMRTLEQLISGELPEALGLAIGFNALDGD